MSQRWLVVGNSVSDLTGPRFKPQTFRSRNERVTARPTGQSVSNVEICNRCQMLQSNKMRFYMQLILNIEIENEPALESTVLYQLQKVFAHLHDSKLQFHVPSSFWKTFKLWGQEVNIREQQDAFEFFTDLTDQTDEYLKVSFPSSLAALPHTLFERLQSQSFDQFPVFFQRSDSVSVLFKYTDNMTS